MKIISVILAFLCNLFGCQNITFKAYPADIGIPKMIVAIGDSTTAGSTGDENAPYSPYTNVFKDRWPTTNLGVVGERSDEILARFDASVKPLNPDIVIIWAGQNDLNIHHKADDIMLNIEAMVENALDLGAAPIVITPPIWPLAYEWEGAKEKIKQIKRLRKLIKKFSDEALISYIEIKKAESDDKTHPNAEQYKEIGETVETVIQRML